MGRTAAGVRGIVLGSDDEVVGMQIDTQGSSLLFATENGMGKRTLLTEFRPQKRGGMGLKCYQITERTGNLIGVKAVTEEHEVMMINTAGIIIQLRASDFNPIGRITQGVKMMNLDDGVKVVRIAKVRGSVDGDSINDFEDMEAAEDLDDPVFSDQDPDSPDFDSQDPDSPDPAQQGPEEDTESSGEEKV